LAGSTVVTAEMRPSDVPFDGHTARALNMGLHHEYLVPMVSRSGVHGVVSLYDEDELGRGRAGLGLAASLASVAGTLLHQSRTVDASVGLVGQLQTALNGRITLEQAKGVLAARDGGSLDAAFGVLRQRARSERRPVADVAAEIVRSL
ncbi:MAG: ANTAR domain-containing protein, partial [Ilumatobacteraceae bacterium]